MKYKSSRKKIKIFLWYTTWANIVMYMVDIIDIWSMYGIYKKKIKKGREFRNS